MAHFCKKLLTSISDFFKSLQKQGISAELEGGGATLLLTSGVLGTGDTAVSEKVRPLTTGTSDKAMVFPVVMY